MAETAAISDMEWMEPDTLLGSNELHHAEPWAMAEQQASLLRLPSSTKISASRVRRARWDSLSQPEIHALTLDLKHVTCVPPLTLSCQETSAGHVR
jgi:hypothetical protein